MTSAEIFVRTFKVRTLYRHEGDNVPFEHRSTHHERFVGPRYEVGNGLPSFGFSQVSSYEKQNAWHQVLRRVVKTFRSLSRSNDSSSRCTVSVTVGVAARLRGKSNTQGD